MSEEDTNLNNHHFKMKLKSCPVDGGNPTMNRLILEDDWLEIKETVKGKKWGKGSWT